jgi:RecA-family ATPase
MNIAAAEIEPEPIEIDPRPCGRCGLTIDKHIRIDTLEGPEFDCDPRELEIFAAATAARLRMEMNDPRDREMARVEIGLMGAGEPASPDGPEAYGGLSIVDGEPDQPLPAGGNASAPAPLLTINPAVWRGTEPVELRWLAQGRIRANDLAILSGNGGAGKTEIAAHLLVSVAADLGDWLGCVVDAGPALFVSCEEDETDVRDRVERIAKHRNIDPHAIPGLHLVFPELDATWLATADQRTGRISKTPLLIQIEAWIEIHRPRLVVIDSVAAVFDGDAIQRRQVRAFLAMLRKIARERDVAILLLDHPSVRGMADGTGTANSVDWRNSVRSMLHLSDPDKDDPDVRTLEVKKNNRGKTGEKIGLRWAGLTFTTAGAGEASPYRAAADRDVDELFLRLLEKRNAQRRPVHAKNAKGSAPAEFANDPDAGGTKAEGFRAAMERLLTSGRIMVVETGSSTRRRSHLERASS